MLLGLFKYWIMSKTHHNELGTIKLLAFETGCEVIYKDNLSVLALNLQGLLDGHFANKRYIY